MGLTAINEVHNHIYYILDDIFVFFYWPEFRIEAFTGYENITRQGYFTGYRKFPGYGKFPIYGNFPGYGRPGIKTCRKTCRNPGYGKISGYVDFPGYGR